MAAVRTRTDEHRTVSWVFVAAGALGVVVALVGAVLGGGLAASSLAIGTGFVLLGAGGLLRPRQPRLSAGLSWAGLAVVVAGLVFAFL